MPDRSQALTPDALLMIDTIARIIRSVASDWVYTTASAAGGT